MKIVDDRTAEQRNTHVLGVAMTDKYMSQSELFKGGKSVACWAVGPEHNINKVENWVRSRGDATYVRVVDLRVWRPKGQGVAHIYVYED